MQRSVSARLTLQVAAPARLAFIVAAAARPPAERLELRHDGEAIEPREVTDAAGTRIHVVDVAPGTVTLDYAATVEGRADEASGTELELGAGCRARGEQGGDRRRDIRPGNGCPRHRRGAGRVARPADGPPRRR